MSIDPTKTDITKPDTSSPHTSSPDTSKDKPDAAKGGGSRGNGVPWLALFVVAALVTLIYVGLSVAAWARADDSDMTDLVWTRLTFVLHGIEAIAFTAIGWLFGREVHRAEAETAKKDKEQAQETARSAQESMEQAKAEKAQMHERGLELATTVRTAQQMAMAPQAGRATEEGGDELEPADGGTAARRSSRSVQQPARPPAIPDHVVATANRLFPAS